MTDAAVQELTIKVGEVYQAVTRMEKRLAEIETRETGKIRTSHPHIVRVQGVCSGRPVIEGTRLSVKLIVGWSRIGMTPEKILAQYPHLSAAQITDALAYYENHPEEIEAEFMEEKRYIEEEIPRLQAMIAERNGQQN